MRYRDKARLMNVVTQRIKRNERERERDRNGFERNAMWFFEICKPKISVACVSALIYPYVHLRMHVHVLRPTSFLANESGIYLACGCF